MTGAADIFGLRAVPKDQRHLITRRSLTSLPLCALAVHDISELVISSRQAPC